MIFALTPLVHDALTVFSVVFRRSPRIVGNETATASVTASVAPVTRTQPSSQPEEQNGAPAESDEELPSQFGNVSMPSRWALQNPEASAHVPLAFKHCDILNKATGMLADLFDRVSAC